MVGLGGGSIPRTFHDLNPDAQQDLVEIDEAVVRVAERFFMFTPNERMRVHVRDARVFVKRALARGQTYDYVMLDAFTGEYIPEHLLTRDFLEEVRGILAPGGVLVATTFSSSRLSDHETATYKACSNALRVTLPTSLNRILVAYDDEWPAATLIDERAAVLGAAMGRFGVDMEALTQRTRPARARVRCGCAPLTDRTRRPTCFRSRRATFRRPRRCDPGAALPLSAQPVVGRDLVATSQPLAAQAGLRALVDGGNAIDAAIDRHHTCRGRAEQQRHRQDAFALVWDGERLHGLNASGRSPAGRPRASPGEPGCPSRLDTITVPGAVSAWRSSPSADILSFARLFEDAVRYAREAITSAPRQPSTGIRRSASSRVS